MSAIQKNSNTESRASDIRDRIQKIDRLWAKIASDGKDDRRTDKTIFQDGKKRKGRTGPKRTLKQQDVGNFTSTDAGQTLNFTKPSFLFQTLAALLITKQVVGNVKEALVPFVKQKIKEHKLKKKAAKEKKELEERKKTDKATADKPKELDNPVLHQAETESNMPEYEVRPATDRSETTTRKNRFRVVPLL